MFIPVPDHGSWFLPIPDPGSKNSNKREGWKKIWCHTLLCSHKFHKIVHYFSFEVLKKKIWANFQRIIELFAQKIVTKLSKVCVWDPGSGIGKNLFRIQGSKRHRIPDPDPQHWYQASLLRLGVGGANSKNSQKMSSSLLFFVPLTRSYVYRFILYTIC